MAEWTRLVLAIRNHQADWRGETKPSESASALDMKLLSGWGLLFVINHSHTEMYFAFYLIYSKNDSTKLGLEFSEKKKKPCYCKEGLLNPKPNPTKGIMIWYMSGHILFFLGK